MLQQVWVRLAQRVHDALAPEGKRLLHQLPAPIGPVAQRLVVAQHRRLAADAVQSLIARIHIAQPARIAIAVQHIVPGGLGAGVVGQRSVDMDVRHQPGSPVQASRHGTQKIGRIAQHSCSNKAGQRHHAMARQPAFMLLAAMVINLDLHAARVLGDGKHAAIGLQLRGFQSRRQLLRQPAIALGPGQHLLAIRFALMLGLRTRRVETMAAGEIVNPRPGRYAAQTGTEIIPAAVVQIPEQTLVIEALLRQPLVETLCIEHGMRGRQTRFALPDTDGRHGKGRRLSRCLDLLFKQRILLQRALAHALHRQQSFVPAALPVQTLLRAMAEIALVIAPAASEALAHAQLLQPVLHLMGIVAGNGQIVGTQGAGNALDLPALAVASHGGLGIEQGCALHASQFQRACRRQPGHAPARNHDRRSVHHRRCGQLEPLRQALPERAQAMTTLQRHAAEAARQVLQSGRWLLAAGQASCAQSAGSRQPEPVAPLQIGPHQCSTLPHSRS